MQRERIAVHPHDRKEEAIGQLDTSGRPLYTGGCGSALSLCDQSRCIRTTEKKRLSDRLTTLEGLGTQEDAVAPFPCVTSLSPRTPDLVRQRRKSTKTVPLNLAVTEHPFLRAERLSRR